MIVRYRVCGSASAERSRRVVWGSLIGYLHRGSRWIAEVPTTVPSASLMGEMVSATVLKESSHLPPAVSGGCPSSSCATGYRARVVCHTPAGATGSGLAPPTVLIGSTELDRPVMRGTDDHPWWTSVDRGRPDCPISPAARQAVSRAETHHRISGCITMHRRNPATTGCLQGSARSRGESYQPRLCTPACLPTRWLIRMRSDSPIFGSLRSSLTGGLREQLAATRCGGLDEHRLQVILDGVLADRHQCGHCAGVDSIGEVAQ